MKKNILLLTTLLLGLTPALAGCSNVEEEDTTYWSNTAIESPTVEASPYQYSLDMIEPKAYRDSDGLALDAGSYISIIGMETGTDFWKSIESGASAAIADMNESLGYTGSDQITFSYSAPNGSDPTNEQINILDSELSRFPVALGISMIDMSAFEVQFDLSVENGTPIIGYDSVNQYDNITSIVSTDNIEASETTIKNLASLMGESGDIILLVHDSSSYTGTLREKTMLEYIELHFPDLNVVQTIRTDDLDALKLQMLYELQPELFVADEEEVLDEESVTDAESIDTDSIENEEEDSIPAEEPAISDDSLVTEGNDDGTETPSSDLDIDEVLALDEIVITDEIQDELDKISDTDVLTYTLESYDTVTGYATTASESCNTLIDILDDIGCDHDNTYIVSFDADTTQVEDMKAGKIDGLLVQNPYGMGYATVIACARAALGLGNESFVDTGYTWVTLDNLYDESLQEIFY